jgi:hypothetical protein
MSEPNKSDQARINGSKSRGPTSKTGKRWSAKNSFKTDLYAKTIHAFQRELQDHYHQILNACRDDYCPSDSLESRRRQHHQLGKPDKTIVQWIDLRTGEPWRPEPNPLNPKNEETNPPTPTKQTPESRQVRRRAARLRAKSLAPRSNR